MLQSAPPHLRHFIVHLENTMWCTSTPKDRRSLHGCRRCLGKELLDFFSKSYIYRKNCYSCPFASEKRVGDLTLGDFWGFHEEYPSYDEKQGLSNGKGVSCILVNTNQGKATLEQCEGQFVLMTSDFEKVARHNDQLHSPSKYSPKREQILELYQKEG